MIAGLKVCLVSMIDIRANIKEDDGLRRDE